MKSHPVGGYGGQVRLDLQAATRCALLVMVGLIFCCATGGSGVAERRRSCPAASDAATAEIRRLLEMVADRASRSTACLEGRGQEVTVDEIETCRLTEGEVEAWYRFTVQGHGNTRPCGVIEECP